MEPAVGGLSDVDGVKGWVVLRRAKWNVVERIVNIVGHQ